LVPAHVEARLLVAFSARFVFMQHDGEPLASEWGSEWIRFDCNDARFRGLEWSVPAAP